MTRVLLVMTTCVAAVASAQQQPTLVPCPVEVLTAEVTPSQLDALQKEYRRQIAAAQVQVPAKSAIATIMSSLGQRDCARSTECLQRAAGLGASLYSLGVVATREVDGAMVVTGRVVRSDGKVMFGPATKKEPRKGKETVEETLARALAALLLEANLGQLPPTKEVPKPPEVVVDAGVVAAAVETPDAGTVISPPPPPPLEPSPLKLAGTTTMIAGGGVALVGAVIFGVGVNEAGSTGETGGAVPSDKAAQAVRARTFQFTGLGVAFAGLAAAGAGMLMYLMAPDDPKPIGLSLVPVPGGSVVVIGGVL